MAITSLYWAKSLKIFILGTLQCSGVAATGGWGTSRAGIESKESVLRALTWVSNSDNILLGYANMNSYNCAEDLTVSACPIS